MAFKAKLQLEGSTQSYTILNFEYEMSQPTDRNGIPRDKVLGNLIELTIESSGRNAEITEWATKHSMKKNGKVIFSRSDADASGKSIAFEDGFCVYHKDIFDAQSEKPMKTILRLSVLKTTYDGSFSIASPGFDFKKAAIDFVKAAGATALGVGTGMAATAAKNAIQGKEQKPEEFGTAGVDGVKKVGDDAISSFIPD